MAAPMTASASRQVMMTWRRREVTYFMGHCAAPGRTAHPVASGHSMARHARGAAHSGTLYQRTSMNKHQVNGVIKGALGKVQVRAAKATGQNGQAAKGLLTQAEGR